MRLAKFVGRFFKFLVYPFVALVVFVSAFNSSNATLTTVLVLTVLSFLIGFIANLGGKPLLRPIFLVMSMSLIIIISAPYRELGDTDNLFWLAYGLGYLTTPLANLKYNWLDKQLKTTKEQPTTTTEQ